MAKKVDPVTLEQKRNAARTTALRRLREAHREDWNRLLKAELDKAGIEWTPPPTEEEKALGEVLERLGKFPELWGKLTGETSRPDLGPDKQYPTKGEPWADYPKETPPADPVLGKGGSPDPAEDITRNDYA